MDTERLESSLPELVMTVDADAVERFAALTGDRSALHMDPVFARRSMYRRRVAHGMLPLLYLARLELPPAPAGRAWRLVRLAARFAGPTMIGDTLAWRAVRGEAKPGADLAYDVTIVKPAIGARVTACHIEIAAGSATTGAARETPGATLMLDALVEQDVAIADIRKGDVSRLRFRIDAAALAAARALAGAPPDPGRHLDLVDLLGACVTSTMAGMCRPGRPATYTDLNLTFDTPLEIDTELTMIATVGFVSASTQMVSQDLSIEAGGSLRAHGSFNVKVNAPPAQMPSFEELERDASDLGIRGKTVLVTGASRGIGETIAKLFAVHGARVFVNYSQSQDDAERVAREIAAHGGWVRAVRADVSDPAQVAHMFATIEAAGALDVLVNNAVGSAFPVDFAELSWDEVARELDVSVKGAFLCCRAAVPLMKRAGGGRIINLSSVFTEDPPAGQLAYVVAKSALVGLTRSLAVELAADNILVNLAVAGFVDTDLGKHVTPVFKERIRSKVPLRRLASPTDVAKGVLVLASSMTAYSSGSKIMMTGGSPPFV